MIWICPLTLIIVRIFDGAQCCTDDEMAAVNNRKYQNIPICLLWHSILLIFVACPTISIPISEFYPYGAPHDNALPQGDEVSNEVQLTMPINFFQDTYDTIFVNTNGLLSFIYEIRYFSNIEFPLEYPVIAPLYSNVDTTAKGKVYYRETNESSLLKRASQIVNDFYPNLPYHFEAKNLFITTWDHVGYHEAGKDKVNTFQAVISTDGHESFVELLYADGGIQWMQAVNQQGLPEARAQAGIVAPGGKFYTLRGSGTDQVINLDKWSNVAKPGLFIFRIGNINDTGNVEAPLNVYGDYNDVSGDAKRCSEGATNCHSNAECYEDVQGYCCRCQPSYFGNGRSCLEREVARRIFGKLKLSIQDVSLEDLDFHGYIVTKDGKIYIAVNNLPETIGYKIQLLFNLDSFVGWLFAAPKGDAKNGYMLTGGVANHTAELTIDDYYRVTIHQRYSGLNLFDHIRMEGEVRGTLPEIPQDIQMYLSDFNELYTRTGPGEFKSSSKHEIQYGTGEIHTVKIDQTIQFTEYCQAEENDMSTMRMESVKNYINYDKDQSILRFASFNRIFRGSEKSEDPCIEGRGHCVANSSCLVEGDGFRCVCNSGFRELNNNLYQSAQTDFGCADINECADGTSACNNNAICVNEIGSYSCQCKPGYTGDGKHCQIFEEQEHQHQEHQYQEHQHQEHQHQEHIPNAVCNIPDRFDTCNCQYGFLMVGADNYAGFSCEDIDECADNDNLCAEGAECINTPGNFTCRCRNGLQGDGTSYCYDVDPCSLLVCPENTQCDSRDGAAHCVCRSGYVGTPPNCSPHYAPVDNNYNEDCSTKGCPEGSRCSYDLGYEPTCICDSGYGTPPDCKTVRTDCNGQACHPSARCIYVPHTQAYTCMCQEGYEGDGFECRLMELSCDESADYCHYNATCIQDEKTGRYICICKEGFEGDGTTCYPISDCQDDRDCGQNSQCFYNGYTGRYECACSVNFRKTQEGVCEPEDNREICSTCHEQAVCVERYGEHDCVCNEGYEGDGYDCRPKILGCDTEGGCSQFADCLYSSSVARYICYCRPEYKGNGTHCEYIITCDTQPDLCSPNAACVYAQDKYICECNDGFYGNGTFCREARKLDEEYLLLNKGRTILQVPFNPTKLNRGRPIHIYENQTAIGIATDCVEGRVYWSDITNLQVKSSKYDGTDFKTFISTGIKSPEGLAIDWLNREVYWTDSGYDQIVAVNLDTHEVRIVASENLVNPRGIAVNPYRRKVYWSDWDRDAPKIEIANLDGSDRQILVQGPSIKLPNSLAIDWSTEELCWADAGTKTIECLNVELRTPRTIVKNCSYPYGLAITDDTYYWTDWNTLKLESSPKNNPNAVKSIDLPLGGYDKLYGVVAVTSCP